MHIQHEADQYYLAIEKQMDEIYPASLTDAGKMEERARLKELLRLSKQFCLRHSEYLKLTFHIDKFVKSWDSDPLFRKEGMRHRHSFVIVGRSAIRRIYDLSRIQSPAALLFDYKSDTDDRIIVIVLNDALDIRQNLYGILHEVGHYVGCRQRSKNGQIDRVQYFIELSLQSFLRSIFLRACSRLLGKEEADSADLTNPSYHPEKQKMMLDIITCLSENNLYNWLYQLLADKVSHIRSERDHLPIVHHAYSKAIASAIDEAFSSIFTDFAHELRLRLRANALTYHLHPDTIAFMMEAFESIINKKPVDFGVNTGGLLEEVAADVFMARVIDMGPMYLEYMLCSYKDQHAHWKDYIKEHLLNDTGERTRLACLQAACMHQSDAPCIKTSNAWTTLTEDGKLLCQVKKELLSISQKLNETLSRTPKVHYISYHGTQRFYYFDSQETSSCILTPLDDEIRIHHANRLRILTPSVTLGRYVRSIMNDKRYDTFLNKHIDTVIELRAFAKLLW